MTSLRRSGIRPRSAPEWMERLARPLVPHANDDEFDDGVLDPAWTTLTVTGGQTIAERDSRLSVAITSGQSSADLNALLKPVTLGVGDIYETHTVAVGDTGGSDYVMHGIVMSDGVVSTSNIASCFAYTVSGSSYRTVRLSPGTFTSVGTSSEYSVNIILNMGIWLRLEYVSANTFRGYGSIDGVSWHAMASTVTSTMTPTHVGIVWSTWGDTAVVRSASFEYIRKVA